MPDHGAEPFIRLAAECEPEVGERRDVFPLIGDLAFVDLGHELKCRNGVLGWISVEIRKFDDLSFHGGIGVGLNLPCQICSVIVALDRWLNILYVLLVEARASSDWIGSWIGVGHDVCLKRSFCSLSVSDEGLGFEFCVEKSLRFTLTLVQEA